MDYIPLHVTDVLSTDNVPQAELPGGAVGGDNIRARDDGVIHAGDSP